MAQGQLNAGHLGGRFLKRAFPQEESNPVPFSVINDGALAEQPKQTLSEANRRVRTSAAMIGLAAISMGAYSLLAPQQGDSAIAAEPVATEPTLPTVSNSPDVAVTSTAPEALPTVLPASTIQTVEHTVQEGQTLWKIAKFYKVDINQLATKNNLSPNAVLYVGQVLQVPGDVQSAQFSVSPAIVAKSELNDGTVTSPVEPVAINASGEPTAYAPHEAQQLLKSRQDVAVANLKQQRDRLKLSLAELKSEESKTVLKPAQVDLQAKAETAGLVSYQISPGDTLTAIAQNHGISYAELAKINQLTNPNLLEVNQFIRVPQAQAALAAQPVASSSQVAATPTETATAASVSLPTVPSLMVANSSEPTLLNNQTAIPLGIGGDASQFALNPARSGRQSPFKGNQAPVNDRQIDSQPYVNSLVSEIVKLRERYQSKSVSLQPRHQLPDRAQAPVPASLSLRNAHRVNSEFKPSRNLEGLQAELQSLRSDRKNASASQTKVAAYGAEFPKHKPQLVAMAPVGSETYAPLVRSSVGKMVSPSLPPLGKPDAYLPGNGSKFNGYIWPAKGMLTSGYGWRWGRLHKGIDIAAPVGTPIVSAAPGKVITAGWNDGGYGNLVEVQHADGSVTLYGHNSRVLVRVGQAVAQGQQIAEMGSTGFSTGPHSHFEVHLPGQGAVNPVAHLPQFRG